MAYCTALLLDRDGTLIQDKHYLADPAGVELLPGVGESLAALHHGGARLFMVSNQSGIGRGMFPREAAVACNEETDRQLAAYGVHLAAMLFCPHAPEEKCRCRKPATGMWEELRGNYALDAATTLMIGDKTDDMRFAANAKIKARALVVTGKGAQTATKLGLELTPAFMEAGYALYPGETRPEYPQILLRGFTALVPALAAYEALVCSA